VGAGAWPCRDHLSGWGSRRGAQPTGWAVAILRGAPWCRQHVDFAP